MTTWNVGFSEPPSELHYFFLKNFEDCDILAIAVQECKYNSWIEKLQNKMRSFKFGLLTVVTMWRMMLCIFVRFNHLDKICNLEVYLKFSAALKNK